VNCGEHAIQDWNAMVYKGKWGKIMGTLKAISTRCQAYK
jgi:hypothetical protein